MTIQSLSPYGSGYVSLALGKPETDSLLPLLLAPDADLRLREAIKRTDLLRYNSQSSRERVLVEIRRRFQRMPVTFWQDYQRMSPTDQVTALFLVLLKTYRLLFDFQTKVVLPRWARLERSLTYHDLRLCYMEIASRDEKVNSWTDNTRKHVLTTSLTIYRQVGLLDREGKLRPLQCGNFDYYLTHGEPWFLEACLMQPYQIKKLKSMTIYDHTRVRTATE